MKKLRCCLCFAIILVFLVTIFAPVHAISSELEEGQTGMEQEIQPTPEETEETTPPEDAEEPNGEELQEQGQGNTQEETEPDTGTISTPPEDQEEGSVEEPAEEPKEEPAEEPTEDPKEETAEEPTEEPKEEPVEEPKEEVTEEEEVKEEEVLPEEEKPKIGDDPNDAPPRTMMMKMAAASGSPATETIDNGDGSFTFRQVIDENCISPYYTRPSHGGGFGIYSSSDQDYGWMHDFNEWQAQGLSIKSAKLKIRAYDVDSEVWHGPDGEYDGLSVDGTMLNPGYLQGTNGNWSETIFDIPLNNIIDDGIMNMFLDIDMTLDGWLTTLEYSELTITYTLDAAGNNSPPFQPVLAKLPGGPVADDKDLVVNVTGPSPADPDEDTVTYEYRWFVDTGNGFFVDDEFAGRGDHTGNTLPAADTVPGETWRVQVIPKDIHGAIGPYSVETWQIVRRVVAFDQNLQTDVDTPIDITLEGYDAGQEALVYEIVSQPESGQLGEPDGNKLTYTPNAGFNGTDTFTFKVIAGNAESNIATVTIAVGVNADVIQFEHPSYTVNENVNGGTLEIVITRTGNSASVVSAVYSTQDDSAVTGNDFTATSGTVAFNQGETSKSIVIPIIDDSAYEGSESFKIILSNPAGGAVLGAQAQAVITIADNDTPPSSSSSSSSSSSPVVESAPDGDLIDRMPGFISISKGVKIDSVKNEIELDYDAKALADKQQYNARVYYWNTQHKKWVALASNVSGEGKIKAVNANGYKGWFKVFGVIQPQFTDVSGHWAETEINRMNGLGMIEGYFMDESQSLDRVAKPEQSVTRTEFVVLLYRLLNINPSEKGLPALSADKTSSVVSEKFTDYSTIPGWAKEAIAAAADAGLVDGRNGEFQGDSAVTRIEAAVMVSRALKKMPTYKAANLESFKDSKDIPDWAKAALAEDVVKGYPDGELKPNDNITRAEAVTVLHRLFVNGMGW